MQRRSRSLQDRLNDIRSRLRTMRTVTNTASATISGGETVVDTDGNISFHDGGRLSLGSSSISTVTGRNIVDEAGNLSADSLVVYGDVLSAADYLYQREAIDEVLLDTVNVVPTSLEYEIGFPDWASSAMVTIHTHINTRIATIDSNRVLITINGKPVARPRSNNLGNVYIDSSVVRRVYPETPTLRISVGITDDIYPSADPRLTITLGGVFSA